MKLNHLFFGAFAAVALVACSDSATDALDPQQKPIMDKDGKGYVAFSVSMPTDNNATRANDDFDKGTAKEYAVKDVALLIFKGVKGAKGNLVESTAKYQQFVNISDVEFGDAANGNITLDRKYVKEITGMDYNPATEGFLGLCVINRNQVFVHNGSTLTIGGHTITAGTTTFGDIQGYIMNTNINANGNGNDENAALWTESGGILMLNAPLYDKPGNSDADIEAGNLNILQDITSSIFATENEAREGACANIYVERAVAKVSVKYDEKTGSNAAFDWSISAWRLDNTNTKSYIVRRMDNFDDTYNLVSYSNIPTAVHRMVGSESTVHQAGVSMGDADKNPRYRTYFAIDPNYNTPGTFNVSTERHTSFGTDFGAYCAENVFDVDHQIWGETTRVIVSAVLTPKDGDSYYAHAGDDKYLSLASVKELAFNYAIAEYRKYIKNLRDANLLTGQITFANSTVTIEDKKNDKIVVTLPTTEITVADGVTDAQVEAAGIANLTKVDQVRGYLDNATYAEQNVTHTDINVRFYNGGTSYYQVRIKHFGDDMTPWNKDEYSGTDNAPAAGGSAAAYPDGTDSRREMNYLGRYGVLRNNWYVVNLTNVIKIGYPTLEDLALDGSGKIDPETPDDHIDKEAWINAEVNILSWAKRFQNNNLGED